MIVTGARCALILFFSVASNMIVTPVLDFLHVREITFAVAAIADKCLPQIWALPFVRIPAALYCRRRIWMRPQRRRVETRPPIFFLTVFHKFLPKRRKAGTSKRNPGSLQNIITLSAPTAGQGTAAYPEIHPDIRIPHQTGFYSPAVWGDIHTSPLFHSHPKCAGQRHFGS